MPDASLYPSAPQPTQGLLQGDPTKLIGVLNTLQEMRLRQQQIPALAQQPAATLQGTNIQNKSALMEQQAAARRLVAGEFGTALAGMESPTADDVHGLTAYIARSHPEIATTYPGIINAAADVALKHPKGIKYGGGILLNMGLSPGEASGLVTGPPNRATGAPTQIPVPSSNLVGARDVGQPPGEADIQAQSAARASQLQSTGATTAQYHADLDNLRQDSKVLDNLGGPTAEVEKKLNQLTQRVGGFGVTMDKDQLRAAESFDKIANQISLNQSKMFHGSDAGLHTVVGANPSLSMSRYGRDGVIDMLQGNQDAIDVTRRAWLEARKGGAPAHAYDTFINDASKVIDPRVFQFNRLSRENRQKFLSQLDPADLPEFEKKYQMAIDRKWVKPLKSQ